MAKANSFFSNNATLYITVKYMQLDNDIQFSGIRPQVLDKNKERKAIINTYYRK